MRRCLVVGAGRIAGGFVAPLLRDAGLEVVLATRAPEVLHAVARAGGVVVSLDGEDRFVDGVRAVPLAGCEFAAAVEGADLIATAVGASALKDVGRRLAPALWSRLVERGSPVDVVTFENHRRAPELLAMGAAEAVPGLARLVGDSLGLGGAAVWRMIVRREQTGAGLRFVGDAHDECYVDRASLVRGAELEAALPGVELVDSFDDRMVEKLWLYNAGHAAAAYLGWQAGCETIDEALARSEIRDAVAGVVEEARTAFDSHLRWRPGSRPIELRPVDELLARYASGLADPVVRVAREPRRKLAAGDRLLGPALAALAAGIRPVALARACAAALAYAESSDAEAGDLQAELSLVGPEEVLAVVSSIHPRDDFARLACASYRELLAA